MKRLVIDTETGGLRAGEHSLLTVGMVLADFTPRRVTFLAEKHIFVKHDEYSVGKTALRVNGINLAEHHKKAITPTRAFQEMDAFVLDHDLFDTPLLGHNVHFDIGFLRALFDELDVLSPFCSQKEDTRYLWEQLKRKGRVNPFYNAKLGTLAAYFGVGYEGAHDAINDCKITAHVYHGIQALQKV